MNVTFTLNGAERTFTCDPSTLFCAFSVVTDSLVFASVLTTDRQAPVRYWSTGS